MSDTIQQEKLRLELGEVFDEFWKRTDSYVKGLIGKPWWTSQKQLIQNEGPLGRMVEHCLIYVIETGDRIEGYKAYTSYLTSEYGSSQTRNKTSANLESAVNVVGTTPLRAVAHNEHELGYNMDWLSEDEADFIYMMHSVRGPETAEMTDMTVDEVWTKYRLIKRKARLRSPK